MEAATDSCMFPVLVQSTVGGPWVVISAFPSMVTMARVAARMLLSLPTAALDFQVPRSSKNKECAINHT